MSDFSSFWCLLKQLYSACILSFVHNTTNLNKKVVVDEILIV